MPKGGSGSPRSPKQTSAQRKINAAVDEPGWQNFRKSLKGKSTSSKLQALSKYQASHPGSRTEIQVENYKNALRRGGQLPPKPGSKATGAHQLSRKQRLAKEKNNGK